MFKRRDGFSLLEILMVIAIMGAVTVGVAQLGINMVSQYSKAHFLSELISLKEHARHALSVEEVCSHNFRGKTIDIDQVATLNLNKITYRDDSPIVEANNPLPGFPSSQITKIEVINPFFFPGDRVLADLSINVSKTGLHALKPRTIPLSFNVASSPGNLKVIEECSFASTDDIQEEIRDFLANIGNCPSGQYLVGFGSDGGRNCANLPQPSTPAPVVSSPSRPRAPSAEPVRECVSNMGSSCWKSGSWTGSSSACGGNNCKIHGSDWRNTREASCVQVSPGNYTVNCAGQTRGTIQCSGSCL